MEPQPENVGWAVPRTLFFHLVYPREMDVSVDSYDLRHACGLPEVNQFALHLFYPSVLLRCFIQMLDLRVSLRACVNPNSIVQESQRNIKYDFCTQLDNQNVRSL